MAGQAGERVRGDLPDPAKIGKGGRRLLGFIPFIGPDGKHLIILCRFGQAEKLANIPRSDGQPHLVGRLQRLQTVEGVGLLGFDDEVDRAAVVCGESSLGYTTCDRFH